MLSPLPGISKFAVNVPNRTVMVDHDDRLAVGDLVAALASLGARGYSANERRATAPHWNVVASGGFLVVSLFATFEDDASEPLWLEAWCDPPKWAALAAIAFGWPPIIKKAHHALTNRVLDVHVLMSLAVIGAVCIEECTEGAVVVVLFAVSKWLEDRATEKARIAVSAVISLQPEQAVLKSGEAVPVEAVQIGTELVVRPGEKIPIDGVVREGGSAVDQAAITGESTPIKKTKGDQVLAGTVNQAGALVIITTKLSGDSAAARLVRLIEDAQEQRSPTELIVDRWAKVYTPIVVLVAVLMGALPWLWADAEFAKEMLYRSLVLLVVACPCALVISTPITYVCALALAARKGILVKGGSHLETLGRLRAIAIDKTGTLTEGRFRLVHFLLSDPKAFTRESALALVAGAEARSSHPLAAAIVQTARLEGLDVPRNVRDFTTEGEGISANVDGKQVQIGNRRMADKHGWIVPPKAGEEGSLLSAAAEWEAEANTVCWVAIDGKLAAVLGVADKIRDEAGEAIKQLRADGVRIVMLTGDNEGTARAVQKQVGLDQIHAKLLPEEKVDFISKLKDECVGTGTVAMVGDGINDAPALSRADVGIAMGAGGTAAALETADVALMDSSLLKLAQARALGVAVLTKIRQNVALSFATKIAMIIAAAVGYAPLWLAVIADVGSMLVVCINGMSILNEPGGAGGQVGEGAGEGGTDEWKRE